MTDLTARLDAIQARKDAATEGPWWHQPYGGQNQNGDYSGGNVFDGHGEYLISEVSDRDGAFIANAPTDIGFLLDLARKQQASIDAVTARLDEWDAMKPFPDVDKTQEWYSLGKRHASESVRFEIREALEAKP